MEITENKLTFQEIITHQCAHAAPYNSAHLALNMGIVLPSAHIQIQQKIWSGVAGSL